MSDTAEFVIHEVFSVTKNPDHYLIDVDMSDRWGVRDRVIYVCRADDPHGASPAIYAWLLAHPEHL
jgi:hypothetical protein